MFEHLKNRSVKLNELDPFRKTAVTVPLIMGENGPEVLFEVRAGTLNHQPNEVCFPGGKMEEGEDPLTCALRETREELLISSSDLQLIAPLDILITPSNLMVYPYLVELSQYAYTYSKDEVDHIFTVPLAYLRNVTPIHTNHHVHTIPSSDFPSHLIPNGAYYPWAVGSYGIYFYPYNSYTIWGITAKILKSFLDLL